MQVTITGKLPDSLPASMENPMKTSPLTTLDEINIRAKSMYASLHSMINIAVNSALRLPITHPVAACLSVVPDSAIR